MWSDAFRKYMWEEATGEGTATWFGLIYSVNKNKEQRDVDLTAPEIMYSLSRAFTKLVWLLLVHTDPQNFATK